MRLLKILLMFVVFFVCSAAWLCAGIMIAKLVPDPYNWAVGAAYLFATLSTASVVMDVNELEEDELETQDH